MIFDNTIKIGKVSKSRSAKGDLQINLSGITGDMFVGEFLILDIDGLKVPFKISDSDIRANSMFVKFEECTESPESLVGRDVFCQSEDLESLTEERLSLNIGLLKGFEVYDSQAGHLGAISSIDTSTANTIIYVQGEKEILIPLAEEFVEEFDIDNKTLRLRLPEGLVSINDKSTTPED